MKKVRARAYRAHVLCGIGEGFVSFLPDPYEGGRAPEEEVLRSVNSGRVPRAHRR